MSKVDEDINNQVSEVPPQESEKTQEDKEIEKLRLNQQGEDFGCCSGRRLIYFKNREPSVY